MAHAFDSGLFVRTPAWHNLGNVVADWPGSWAEARKLGGLDWEPYPEPVYRKKIEMIDGRRRTSYTETEGWKHIVRNDSDIVLGIQMTSYEIINNTRFGEVIETVMDGPGVGYQTPGDGEAEGLAVKYETVLSLYGGRMIVATLYLDQPLEIGPDPSQTYQYIVFVSRHDGAGGLRVIFTNVRVVCANTLGSAERLGKEQGTYYTIRHTANWEERVAEMRTVIQLAQKDSVAWAKLATQLGSKKVGVQKRETYLARFLPTRSDMTDRQVTNVHSARDSIREILASSTCEHISNTAYGLVMASTEWTDHVRRSQTPSSAVMRSLIKAEPYKIKAIQIAKELIGAK